MRKPLTFEQKEKDKQRKRTKSALLKARRSYMYSLYTRQFVTFIKDKDGNQSCLVYERNGNYDHMFYVPYNEGKIIYDVDENHKAFLRIEYDKTKVQRAKVSKLAPKKLFIITENGILISRRTKKVLSQYLHPNGYWMHASKIGGRNGINVCFKIHRLIAHAFCPRPERHLYKDYEELQVNHKDGVKTNNHYTNLEWCTNQENTIHAYKTGLMPFGIDRENAKLTKEQVNWIRQHKKDNPSTKHRWYAEMFNIDRSNITEIINNVIYKDSNYTPPNKTINYNLVL
jgi:hypothetical protein